ncbi:MAG: bifunctional metallophosphatase/5'-nucleotidase [bacterium]|nr:bifunctional metallophosphatase/5'-nucleotidase [bacterium]
MTIKIKKAHLLLLVFVIVLVFCVCSKESTPDPTANTRQITLLYTNDEHGWMEATPGAGGAAGMMGLWRENEGYTENGPFLILSGGDMWTGPAISTWFRGESMVDVMNSMNYGAAAIGNHEFDFQTPGLALRLEQAEFPFLSANIRLKSNGDIPGFATPFIVKEVAGIRIGLIGLSSVSTPTTTFPDYVEDYDFIPYETALRELVPQVRDAGAEILIIVGHICTSEMVTLSSTASELGISVIGGGHCHEAVTRQSNGVSIIQAGSNLRNYAKVVITFDMDTRSVSQMQRSIRTNSGGAPDETVASVVSSWRIRVDAELSEVIGFAQGEIVQHSPPMYNMIVDSWLDAFPSADIAVSNTGGVRQSILAGDISLAVVVGVLPFENTLYQLELTGEQIITCLDSSLFVGGMTTVGGYFLADGSPLEDGVLYNVLVTDFIYSAYESFSGFDSTPTLTGVQWRSPVIDWIRSLNTSSETPLEQYLDYTARQ